MLRPRRPGHGSRGVSIELPRPPLPCPGRGLSDDCISASNALQAYFEYLDKAGGFFYERWGDAPVHSLAAAMFLNASEVCWRCEGGGGMQTASHACMHAAGPVVTSLWRGTRSRAPLRQAGPETCVQPGNACSCLERHAQQSAHSRMDLTVGASCWICRCIISATSGTDTTGARSLHQLIAHHPMSCQCCFPV